MKKNSQNPLIQFFKKLENFNNFIRILRLPDHKKITFAIKYLPTSRERTPKSVVSVHALLRLIKSNVYY